VDVLIQLTQHKKDMVLDGVAKNINTPVDILREIAHDKYLIYRGGIIHNTNSCIEWF